MFRNLLLVLCVLFFAISVYAQECILPFKHKGLWGLMDTSKRVVMQPMLKERTFSPDGGYLKIKNEDDTAYINRFGLADTIGKILVPALYWDVHIKANYFEAEVFGGWSLRSKNYTDIYTKAGVKVLSVKEFKRSWNEDDGAFKSILLVQTKQTMSLYKVNWLTAESAVIWTKDSCYFDYVSYSRDTFETKRLLYINFSSPQGWRKLEIDTRLNIKEEELRDIFFKMAAGIEPEAHAVFDNNFKLLEPHGKLIVYKEHRNANKKLYKVVVGRRKDNKKSSWREGSLEDNLVYDTSSAYNQIIPNERGYSVRLGKRWGLMDFRFNLVVPVDYSEVKVPNFKFKERRQYWDERKDEDLVLIRQKRYWGIYSLEEKKLLVPCLYDSLLPVNRYSFVAKKNGFWGVISEDHVQLIPFKLERLAWDNQFPVCIAQETSVILAGYEKGKLKLHAPWKSFVSDVYDAVKSGGDNMIYLYKNGKVSAYCLMDFYEFFTPYLNIEFTIVKDELYKTLPYYYWLETVDKQTGGYIRRDGVFYFKVNN